MFKVYLYSWIYGSTCVTASISLYYQYSVASMECYLQNNIIDKAQTSLVVESGPISFIISIFLYDYES